MCRRCCARPEAEAPLVWHSRHFQAARHFRHSRQENRRIRGVIATIVPHIRCMITADTLSSQDNLLQISFLRPGYRVVEGATVILTRNSLSVPKACRHHEALALEILAPHRCQHNPGRRRNVKKPGHFKGRNSVCAPPSLLVVRLCPEAARQSFKV